MSKPNTKNQHALTVLASTELMTKDTELDLLKETALKQFSVIAKNEKNVARGGVICGLTLHRVKASMKHGEFTPFLKDFLPRVSFLTPATSIKNASFYMRLAEVFIEKSKVSKPDILALPGDPLSLDLGDNHSAKRFLEKLDKFAGDKSLNELLIAHNIKGVGLKKELTPKEDDDTPPPVPTPEQLYDQYRDEIGALIARGEALLLNEGALSHLIGHPEELKGVSVSLTNLAKRVAEQVEELVAKEVAPSAEPAIPAAEDV